MNDQTDVVAAEDGKRGCPVMRWDLVKYRCSLGVDACYLHGKFATVLASEHEDRSPQETP